MKKKVLITAISFVSLFFTVFLCANSSVQANTSPDCINGCLPNGDGCVCNGYWECYLEDDGGNSSKTAPTTQEVR